MTSPSAPRPAPASTAGGPGLVSIACTAALGFFLFGYDTSVINGSIDALSDHFGLSTGMRGFTVSSALLGCVVGAWFAGSLANRFGRTRLMVVAAILFLISAIGSAAAFGTIDSSSGGSSEASASGPHPSSPPPTSPKWHRLGRVGSSPLCKASPRSSASLQQSS